jgi:hypothetical protein
MKSSKSKARRTAHAAQVAARRVHSSGTIKCYVEYFHHPNGRPDLRLREKVTRRVVRVLTGNSMFQDMAPLANLLQDCYGHGGGLVEPRSRHEYITISASTLTQNDKEVAASFDGRFAVTVKIQTTLVASPPVSVWCYVEEYEAEDGAPGLRLRQKVTGRKVEMYGEAKKHLITFLASPQFTGGRELMPNLYEADGYLDYVLVSGGAAVDSYDVLRFSNSAQLTYLLGPTPDTAYRDAFRVLKEEAAAVTHSRTAVAHLEQGRYREAVLSARLAAEMACGGGGLEIKRRLAGAPPDVAAAGALLYDKRKVAVHEGGTRIEQRDAEQSLRAMNVILHYLGVDVVQL